MKKIFFLCFLSLILCNKFEIIEKPKKNNLTSISCFTEALINNIQLFIYGIQQAIENFNIAYFFYYTVIAVVTLLDNISKCLGGNNLFTK